MRVAWDIESTNLINSNSVDYCSSPYKFKDDYKIHCIAAIDVDTNNLYTFVEDEIHTEFPKFLENVTELIAHNQISFDLQVIKSVLNIDFEIGVFDGVTSNKFYGRLKDSLNGRPITITDTLVMSKCLNPDRGGHSINYFGKMHGEEKIDWRAVAIELGLIKPDDPKGAEFKTYHPKMLEYNIQDVKSNIKTWKFLLREWGDWNWKDAYELEKVVAEIISRQEHRGFWFDKDKAVECVKDLDDKMERLKVIVEPLIPNKLIGKTAAKEFIPPKIQFKKDGTLSSNIIKWVAKHNGVIENNIATIFNKKYILPIPQEPIVTHIPATIKDTTHIKGWLVEMGWKPSAYKERDLTVDVKKHKLSLEAYIATCERYISQTMASPFKEDRFEQLEVDDEVQFRNKLLKHSYLKRPLKVLTNPTLTVGMEKEIDPNLLLMEDKFAHAKDVSNYLTYSHRRNSILGGGVDPDAEDTEEDGKGWLAVERLEQDGRIPTPADTCGAGTSRFKHRLVANIPRISSLYGEELRSLFGVNIKEDFFQLGYDFASLEAMIESHYCSKHDDAEKTYCKSLIMEKPNDIHSLTAKKISDVLGREFGRTPAKAVKYAASYGARVKRIAKTVGCSMFEAELIFNAFWDAAQPLAKLMDSVTKFWEDPKKGNKKFITGLDGRKVPTRSASALINSLFQSAGVICAKRAMVIHDRKLKDAGLSVDFWNEDWKNKKFVQQLIAYHK